MTHGLQRELDYAAAPPRSGLATAALVLGICSLPLLLACGIGVIPGILAIVLGGAALRRITAVPMRYGGKGAAVAAMWLGVVSVVGLPIVVVVMGAVLTPRPRVRVTCSANLVGIGRAMVVYAGDNAGYFPAVAPTTVAGEYTYATGVAGSASTGADALNAMMPKAGSLGPPGVVGNPLACLWILVLTNQVAPKALVCRTDPWGSGASALTATSGGYYYTVDKLSSISYSIAYPWATPSVGTTAGAVGEWWKDRMDAEQPLACDMAPMHGTGKPVRVTNPGTPPRDPRTWLSGNHDGDGQNVVYGDAHVDWVRTPVCGAKLPSGADNMFTSNQTGAGTSGDGLRANGRIVPPRWVPPPAVPRATGGPFDVIMVPVRNLDTGGF